MILYPSFAYLQNQKTGCTFVETFLLKFCSEKPVLHDKHASFSKNPSKFCFINVREPISQYKSLFAYGLDRKGEIFMRLSQHGKGQLYSNGMAGFDDWLRFVLDRRNARVLSDNYTESVANLMGLLTWRFLRLACPGFEKAAVKWTNHRQMAGYIKENYIINKVLKQERLKEDLKALVENELRDFINDHDAAMAWLEENDDINSSREGREKAGISATMVQAILNKEGLLYSSLYPAAKDEMTRRLISAQHN